MPKLAMSYRRQDAPGMAGRIRDKLALHYGATAVFMDIDNMPLGTDFREHLGRVLGDIDILLAIVGPRWLGLKSDGTARIRDKRDYLRLEIAAALQRKIPVVPILVEGAEMPKEEDLPDEIASFAYRHGAEVDTGIDFHAHMDRIIKSLDQILASEAKVTTHEGHVASTLPSAIWLDDVPVAPRPGMPWTPALAPHSRRVLHIATEFAATKKLTSKNLFYISEFPKEVISAIRSNIDIHDDENILVVISGRSMNDFVVFTDMYIYFKSSRSNVVKVAYMIGSKPKREWWGGFAIDGIEIPSISIEIGGQLLLEFLQALQSA